MSLINKMSSMLKINWGKKVNYNKQSEFFEGHNIISRLSESSYGKTRRTLDEFFTAEELSKYELPKVITIGNESSGKSSLLENITKCKLFPRHSNVCTKCPIHVKLCNGHSKYSLKYDGETEYFQNKFEIYESINKKMQIIPDDEVLDKEIYVEICDIDMPTFEFYDLPGIRTYPYNLATKTTDLCKKYLADKNAIILCAIPATTTRLTSCQSIALIKETGNESNCIMVLTMSDRLQHPNIEDLLIKRIIGDSEELRYLNFAGCVAIANRAHTDLYSLSENDRNESKWFDDNIISIMPDDYKNYEKHIIENITIPKLITKMDELYTKYIRDNWRPRILLSIEEKIMSLKKDFQKIGPEDFDVEEYNLVITERIQRLVPTFRTFLERGKFEELFKNKEIDNNNETELNKNDDDTFYLNPVDKMDKETSMTIEEIYHETLSAIERKYEIYTKGNIKFIHDKIGRIFSDKEIPKGLLKYKLARFDNIRENICKGMQDKYTELVEKKLQRIYDNTIFILRSDYITNQDQEQYAINDEMIITGFDKLFWMEIIYPLLQNPKLVFGKCDYIENDITKTKRIEISEQVNKLGHHASYIQNL